MKKRGLKRGVLTAVAIAVAAICALALAVSIEAGRRYEPEPADCMIVLGCHVWMSGELSQSLERRCETALRAWQDGLAPVMILCGRQGSDEPTSEAAAMRDWLVARGVPEEALLLEDRSANTEQNLINARAIMDAQGFQTAVICTSNYHLRRAMWIAADNGISATALAAPSPDNLFNLIKSRFREGGSWVLYWVRKLF